MHRGASVHYIIATQAMATDYLELNKEVLEELKESDPVKYRSLKLYLECQNIFAETGDWNQAAAHWNAWAEKLLAQRQELGKSGKWEVEKHIPFGIEGKNIQTRAWIKAARIDFSNFYFDSESSNNGNKMEKYSERKKHFYVLAKYLSFMGFIFPCDASFWNSKFKGDFTFSYAIIEGDAIFQEATFCGAAWFLCTVFYGRVCFNNAKFEREANFENVMFNRNSKFLKVRFGGAANFKDATFIGDAYFRETSFKSDADFKSSFFYNDANFFLVTFGSNSLFRNTKFNGKTNFKSVKFKGGANFRNSTFGGATTFFRVIFSGDVAFEEVKFDDYTRILDTTFRGVAIFGKAQFNGKTNFRVTRFEQPVTFQGAEFQKTADFSIIRSEKGFSLHEARFRVVPDFNEAVFHSPPVLDNIKIGEQLIEQKKLLSLCRPCKIELYFKHVPEPEKNAKRISRNFRALSKMAHEARDWLNEMEFFAQEIRARRFSEDFPLGEYRMLRGFGWWLARKCHLRLLRPLMLKLRRKVKSSSWRGPNVGRFWFGLIYEKASNFGRSFARPLALWAVSTALFALIYAVLACEWGAWSWWDALYLSMRHGLVVGGLVRTGHMQQVIEAMFGELGSGLALLMMGQTLVSAFFLFLFFLAVRNHFRIR